MENGVEKEKVKKAKNKRSSVSSKDMVQTCKHGLHENEVSRTGDKKQKNEKLLLDREGSKDCRNLDRHKDICRVETSDASASEPEQMVKKKHRKRKKSNEKHLFQNAQNESQETLSETDQPSVINLPGSKVMLQGIDGDITINGLTTSTCTSKKKSKSRKNSKEGMEPFNSSMSGEIESSANQMSAKKKRHKGHEDNREQPEKGSKTKQIEHNETVDIPHVPLKKKKKRKKDIMEAVVGSASTHHEENEVSEIPLKKRKKDRKEPVVDSVLNHQEENEVSEILLKKKKKRKKDKMEPVVDSVLNHQEETDKSEIPLKKKEKRKKDRKEPVVDSVLNHQEENEVSEIPIKKKKKRKKDRMEPVLDSVSIHQEENEVSEIMQKPKKTKNDNDRGKAKHTVEETPDSEPEIKKNRNSIANVDINASDRADKEGNKKHKRKKEKSTESCEKEETPIKKKKKLRAIEACGETENRLTNSLDKEYENTESQMESCHVALESDPKATESTPSLGQWGTAQFDSATRQQKFLRLLGGFKKASPGDRTGGELKSGVQKSQGKSPVSMALDKKKQTDLQDKLEHQFEKARAFNLSGGGKGGGLGYTPPPGQGKKFYIDASKSASVKFDE